MEKANFFNSVKAAGNVISIQDGGNLTITDSSADKTGVITGGNNIGNGGGIINNGILTLKRQPNQGLPSLSHYHSSKKFDSLVRASPLLPMMLGSKSAFPPILVTELVCSNALCSCNFTTVISGLMYVRFIS